MDTVPGTQEGPLDVMVFDVMVRIRRGWTFDDLQAKRIRATMEGPRKDLSHEFSHE